MDELTQAVNLALDTAKGEMTEGYLAAQLGVDRMTLWRWRNGRFSQAFRMLMPITVMVGTPLPPGAADQATDIRVLAPLLAMPHIDT